MTKATQIVLGLFLSTAGFLGTAPNSMAATENTVESIQVLALVAGRAVTSRQVEIDAYLENPTLYAKAGQKLSDGILDQALQRVLTQIMIVEESRIVGSEFIDRKNIDQELYKIKSQMSTRRWLDFLAQYELTEADVKKRLEDKMQVQNALDARVRLASTAGEGSDVESEIRRSIEDWLNQLRSRYRVQRFRYDR